MKMQVLPAPIGFLLRLDLTVDVDFLAPSGCFFTSEGFDDAVDFVDLPAVAAEDVLGLVAVSSPLGCNRSADEGMRDAEALP